MIVRPAVLEDLPQLMEMGRDFFDEAQWVEHGLALHAPSLATTLVQLMDGPHGILLVAANEQEPVGMIGGLVYPWYFDHSKLAAQELFWYIRPNSRGTPGLGLLKAFEETARAKGASTIILTASAGLRADGLERLYRRKGYRPAERTYFRSA